MNTFDIDLTYTSNSSTRITLPDGKTWDDVLDFYIKWNTLYIRLKGEEEYRDFDLSNDFESDTKRPSSTCIIPVDEDGIANYDDAVFEN